MSNKKAASAGLLVVGLIVIIGIAAAGYYYINGGFPGSGSTSTPSTFTTTSTSSVSTLQGRSVTVLLQYYNPFPEAVSSNVQLNALASSIVSPATQSKSIPMIANMPTQATASFNLTCGATSANQESTTTFNVYVSSYTQNLTSDIVTYAYGTPASSIQTLLPQIDTVQGFLTITATPVEIMTGGSAPPTGSITLSFSPAVYPGLSTGVYTGAQAATPNNVLTSLTITINDASGGIASAVATNNGNQVPFVKNGNLLTLTLNSLNLEIIGYQLPIEITAASTNASTENTVTVSTSYNYQYSISGPTVSCQ
jgi:hypothetical protein